MIRMFSRKQERTLETLARLAGGERELEKALRAFQETYGVTPTGQQLLGFIYDRRHAGTA